MANPTPYTGRFGQPCISGHTAVIYDRGGTERVNQIVDLASVKWSRKLQAMTQAVVTVTGRSCVEQQSILNAIQAKRHEIRIYRGAQPVWEGPIQVTRSTSGVFEITANDVLGYLAGTTLTKEWPPINGDGSKFMTQRLREILNYELSTPYVVQTSDGPVTVPRWETVSPAANILPFLDIRDGPTLTFSDTTAFQMSVAQHLTNLGGSIGVGFTTVGRKILIWDGFLGQTRQVTEKDLSGDFNVYQSGSDFNNIQHVPSSTVPSDGSAPAVGHAVGNLSYFGPWESVVSTTSQNADGSAPSQPELNSQADNGIKGSEFVPLELVVANGSVLIPSPGMTINDLVAGVNVPVRAASNIKTMNQMQMLTQLDVTEDATGEKIAVTFGTPTSQAAA